MNFNDAIATGLAKGICDDVERGLRCVTLTEGDTNGHPTIFATVEYDEGFLDHEGDEPTGNYGDVTRHEYVIMSGVSRIYVREIRDGSEKWTENITRIAEALGTKVEWNATHIPTEGVTVDVPVK